jgi:hypothetical protein
VVLLAHYDTAAGYQTAACSPKPAVIRFQPCLCRNNLSQNSNPEVICMVYTLPILRHCGVRFCGHYHLPHRRELPEIRR